MNKWKALAILFTVFSLGAINETTRIFTSDAADISKNRTYLVPFALVMTGIFIFLTIWFWRKSK